MNKPGRPPVITNEIAQIIAKMKDRHPNWSVREYEQKFDDFAPHELKGKGPGRTALNDYISNKMNRNIEKMGIERAWSSAELNNENIDPESIRWLIALQVYRKSYYSKPLMVREAKWFSRLSGLRSTFSSDLSDLGIPSGSRDVFITHVIAGWAQIYAYREKIDILAGIENLDFSDMDNKLANSELNAIYEDNSKLLFDQMGKIANKDDVSKKDIEDFDEQYLGPSLIDNIRFQEMAILGHNLGDPDMPHESTGLYSTVLTWILVDNPPFFECLVKVPYPKKVEFLTSLREWAKNNSGVADDEDIVSKVNDFFDNVKDKGALKVKFKAGYRITIDDLQKLKEKYEKEGKING